MIPPDRAGPRARIGKRVPGGALHSPDDRQLLFAQVDGERSGDLFLVDPEKNADTAWLPRCRAD